MNRQTLILQDAIETTPGTTEVTIAWNNKGVQIHSPGYDNQENPPILIQRHGGHIRLVVWADINNLKPTHVISLAGAYKSQLGQPIEHRDLVARSIPANYTSVWKTIRGDEIKINSSCLYDPIEQVVFDIEESDVNLASDDIFVEQYITMGDITMKESDGVRFVD